MSFGVTVLLWIADNLDLYIMATYAKILKDPSGHQILPYTRAKLVYMDDNTTVQNAVLQPATNVQMGRVLIGNNLGYDGKGTISLSKFGVCNALGYTPVKPDDYEDNNKYGVVKVGSNILEEDGVISVDDRCIKEALGYTPTSSIPKFSKWTLDNLNTVINDITFKGQSSTLSKYFSSIEMRITSFNDSIFFCRYSATTCANIPAKTIFSAHTMFLSLSIHGGESYRNFYPLIYQSNEHSKICGYFVDQINVGGISHTIPLVFTETITANSYIASSFTLYPF